ncbi:BNR-4 repeat-containing protein [Leifsonia sp. McL0607]|uniref:BNR-4 repeat-containing protein n=1 Tax=Leifsonia sp. McL0607 TaxID=3415672 RepID=UPI003CEA31E3
MVGALGVVALIAGLGLPSEPAQAVANGGTGTSNSAFTEPERSATASDSFRRADANSLGSPWKTVLANWELKDNSAVPDPKGQDAMAINHSVELGSSFVVSTEITASTDVNGRWAGLVFNASSDATDRFDFRVTTGPAKDWMILRRTLGEPGADIVAMGKLKTALVKGDSYIMSVDRSLTSASVSFATKAEPGANLVIGGDSIRMPYAHSGLPTSTQPRVGGYAGLLSNVGAATFRDFSVRSTTDTPSGLTDWFAAGTDLSNTWKRVGSKGWKSTPDGTVVPEAVPGRTEYVLEQEHVDLSGSSFSFAADMTIPAWDNNDMLYSGLAFHESIPPANADGAQLQMYRFMATPFRKTSVKWALQKVVGDIPQTVLEGYFTPSKSNSYTVRVDSPTPGTFDLDITDRDTGKSVTTILNTPVPTTWTDPAPLRGGMAALYSFSGTGEFDNVSLVSAHSLGVPEVVSSTLLPVKTLGHSITGQSVLTDGNTQYVAFYDTKRYLSVASRTLNGSAPACANGTLISGWCIFRSDHRVNDDQHNYVTMQLDGQKQLHVMGNLKVGRIVVEQNVTPNDKGELPSFGADGLGEQGAYLRTSTAGDVSSLGALPFSVPGIDISAMTYPEFFTVGDTLVLRFRQGKETFLAQYDSAAKGWVSLLGGSTPLFATDSTRRAYPTEFVAHTVNGKTTYGMAWSWDGYLDENGQEGERGFGSRSTFSYAQSTDLKTWTTANGTPLSVPLTYEQTVTVPGLSIDPDAGIKQGITQPSLALNGLGHPVVTYTRATTGANPTMQAFATTFRPGAKGNADGTWKVTQLTSGNQNIIPDNVSDSRAPWNLQAIWAAAPYGANQPTWMFMTYVYMTGFGRVIIDTSTGEIVADLPGATSNSPGVPPGDVSNFARDLGAPKTDGTRAVLFWPSWPAVQNDNPKNPEGGDAYCDKPLTASAPNCDLAGLKKFEKVPRYVSKESYHPTDMYVLTTRR